MSKDSIPVLPWANCFNPNTSAPRNLVNAGEKELFQTVPINDVGLQINDIIEVKWHIEPDEGKPYYKWWRSKVVSASPLAADNRVLEGRLLPPPGAPVEVVVLEYEAFEDFDAETAEVVFLSDRSLLNVPSLKAVAPADQAGRGKGAAATEGAEDEDDEPPLMPWRREGDEWDGPSGEEEEEEEEDADLDLEGEEGRGGATLSLRDLNSDMVRHEREWLGGRTLEQAEAEALAPLEAHQRASLAAGFRSFADKLTEFLHQKEASAAASGAPVVITEEDIHDFRSRMCGDRNKPGRRSK